MARRIMVLTAACVLAIPLFAGGQKEPPKGAAAVAPAAPQPPAKVVHDTDFDNLSLTVMPGTGSKGKAGDLPTPAGHTVVEFWYSVGAAGGKAIEEIAMDFDNTVGKAKKIWVKPTFQGAYDATAVKLEAVLASRDISSYPDLVNVNANGIILFLDTPEFVPFSDLAARDPDFPMDKMNKNALDSLTYQGKVLTYPQGISMPPLMYYNKTMFKDAGLDPENPPGTLAGYAAILPKLTRRDESGKIKVYGMATTPELMHLHNWLGMQKGREYMFDNKSGHDGTPTKVLFGENGSMLRFLNEWKKLLDTGCLDYFSDARLPAFRNKQTAIVFLSSLQVMQLVNTPPDFEWAAIKIPRLSDNDHQGMNTGGSSVYVLNRGEKQLDATWAFIKFMSLPEPSAKWFIASGYYPQNMEAFDLPEVKELFKKNPQMDVLITAYKESVGMSFLSPIWVPSFGELNQFYIDTIIGFGKGTYTAEKAVESMVNESQRELDTYNRLKGK